MSCIISTLRDEFPATQRVVSGRPVIYLDSAATYLKPQSVIDAVTECYRNMAGTVGRGVHVLAEEAMAEYEMARETIANFINADPSEIVFVRNATEALNLVALSLPGGSRILGSLAEHHSNLLPWRMRHEVQFVGLQEDGTVDIDDLQIRLEKQGPELLTTSTIGNAFGTVHPTREIIENAHTAGCDVLLDVNQSIAHRTTDVRELDCEYLCFSGHKLGAPTGIGVLYAKRDRLERLQPWLTGGGTVNNVHEEGQELADLPMRLEPGTAPFEGAIGLAAACNFFSDIGMTAVAPHEKNLTERLIERLSAIDRISIRGPAIDSDRGAIVAFQIDGLEAHGAARMLSKRANICVRSGFHCAQPAHEYFGWRPTIRASFGVYNTEAEVDVLADSLEQITANLF